MGIFSGLTKTIRLRYHQREIRESLRFYRDRTGWDAGQRQSYAESGSFRSQLDRLFTLGNAAETGELERIAGSVVAICLSNKYYRPADYLSDIIDDLERHTFLSGEPDGELPFPELDENGRRAKLARVMESWLAPIKVASIENLVEAFAHRVGRSLSYKALGRFEREAARLYALLGESETQFVEERLVEFLENWKVKDNLRQRFAEPAEALKDMSRCLEGKVIPEGTSALRVRSAAQPLRLSTLVPEDRQQLLEASLRRLG